MEIKIFISIASFFIGFIIGRRVRFKIKNYGVSKKMYLTLERTEIDRKIGMALELEDYEYAMVLHKQREKLDRKLKRIDRKNEKRNKE